MPARLMLGVKPHSVQNRYLHCTGSAIAETVQHPLSFQNNYIVHLAALWVGSKVIYLQQQSHKANVLVKWCIEQTCMMKMQ